ncbi:HxlR-like helix-turn-helix [uncultured archaeon]|nr:HxlR-like helix-turn-helix [uncultured archaeon]
MSECPVYKTVKLFGKKWTLEIFQEIACNGQHGFNGMLHKMSKISPAVLSRRLEEMEETGLIRKAIISKTPPIRVMYRLTEKGQGVRNIVTDLIKLEGRYADDSLDCNNGCLSCYLYKVSKEK